MRDEKTCPICGYLLSIPLKPSDSKVTKVWSLYCPRCGHTWAVKEPVEDVV